MGVGLRPAAKIDSGNFFSQSVYLTGAFKNHQLDLENKIPQLGWKNGACQKWRRQGRDFVFNTPRQLPGEAATITEVAC
jgi:hypothetical protein